MTDLPREVTAADIAKLLNSVDRAAWRVGYDSRDSVLDADEISVATGIASARVGELLDGAEPEQPPRGHDAREAYYRRLVGRRLNLLRSRAEEAGEAQSYRRIGDEVDLSHTLVGHLVNGTRSAKVDYSSPLEERYGVPHGFLSKPEGSALAEHLTKIKDGLLAGALHRGIRMLGGQRAALRHTGDAPPTMETLLEALDDLMAARTDIQDSQAHSEPDGK
ncbi:hypothetical protein [Streptomyces olivochromogenes]|uniref:hypothetical protein n=1 Tax=Streptomyces olivochromogenes TaxID=1963 RepID=UPI001F2C24EC|nr:hypothetical protein [Streptomyces olivochromogenes]MCF3128933.1 hypothetical protein [Streptomyces olivochromogenes]